MDFRTIFSCSVRKATRISIGVSLSQGLSLGSWGVLMALVLPTHEHRHSFAHQQLIVLTLDRRFLLVWCTLRLGVCFCL